MFQFESLVEFARFDDEIIVQLIIPSAVPG